MIIERTFRISKAVCQYVSNAPYKIVMCHHLKDCEVSFVLDKTACKEYNIDMGLAHLMPGKELSLSLESTEIASGTILSSNFLEISFEKKESTSFSRLFAKLKKNYSQSMILRLLSCGAKGDGVHFHELPSPLYKIDIELNESEFKECKRLSYRSLFQIKDISINYA